ncbi:MAG: DUF1569 domain-containing protein [Chitinophagia bacterium]|nr:DUF1569 domain-containing protein [Chitinophagia bacterium]
MNNIFDQSVAEEVIHRIGKLTPETQPVWGKMSVGQMLAHCNVTYEMVFEPAKHPKPTGFMAFVIRNLIKGTVTSEKPYKKNSATAPAFLITDARDFTHERNRLTSYITQVQHMGADAFDGKESHSFGPLTKVQWNNMFYKHLDHHLSQFGV